MNITVEKLPNCKASVRVQVPQEKRSAARDAIVKSYMKYAALPGFRKGKAPRNVVERKFKDEIEKEVTDQIVNEGLREAVEREKLNVISVANFKPEDAAENGDYQFTLELVLAPEFELPEYKGLTIKVPNTEVTDQTVEDELQRMRERLAELQTVEGRGAKEGDFIVADYSGSLDGKPLKEVLPAAESFIAENHDFLLKLDKGNFVPGFTEQLEGAAAGETREVKVTMPEQDVNEAVAGKEVVYTVTVKEVKEAKLPELNDEFAGKLLEGKTLEELRKLIRESSEAQAKQKDLENKRVAAMQALREKVEFDLPENVVNSAAQRRANELVRMNLERGLTREMINENSEAIIQAASEQAKIDVKDEFLLMEVVKKENLQVTREDLVSRVSAIAYRARVSPDKVVKDLQKNNGAGMENVKHSILLAKALDVLVENATVEYETAAASDGAES